MTATLLSSSWPASPAVAGDWRFGRVVLLAAPAGGAGAGTALQWVLKRNCSITPRQLGAVYLSLCAVSLLIAAGFWWHGAPAVTIFAGVELLLVGLALLVYARHAGDREVLTLHGRTLQVECSRGSRTETADFQTDWLAVEPSAGQGSLVELSGRGQSLRVGRFLRPEVRAAFAQELRRAVRRMPAHEHEIERN